jgi:hypothetical protein
MGTILSKIDEVYEDTRERLMPKIEELETAGRWEEARKLREELKAVDPFYLVGPLHLPNQIIS